MESKMESTSESEMESTLESTLESRLESICEEDEVFGDASVSPVSPDRTELMFSPPSRSRSRSPAFHSSHYSSPELDVFDKELRKQDDPSQEIIERFDAEWEESRESRERSEMRSHSRGNSQKRQDGPSSRTYPLESTMFLWPSSLSQRVEFRDDEIRLLVRALKDDSKTATRELNAILKKSKKNHYPFHDFGILSSIMGRSDLKWHLIMKH